MKDEYRHIPTHPIVKEYITHFLKTEVYTVGKTNIYKIVRNKSWILSVDQISDMLLNHSLNLQTNVIFFFFFHMRPIQIFKDKMSSLQAKISLTTPHRTRFLKLFAILIASFKILSLVKHLS